MDHYSENKPLYVYENDYIEFPRIHLEVMTLKHLEEKDESKALIFWNKLHTTNPEIYGEKFVYHGDKCLFSMCLTRALAHETPMPILAGGELTKEELIFNILSQSKAPVQKEKMFELVYGIKPKDKVDMARLSNLISKLKRKKDIKIINRKNCYILAS